MAKMSLAVAGTLEELVTTSILSRMSVTIRRLLTCANDENKGHAQDYCYGGWSVGTASKTDRRRDLLMPWKGLDIQRSKRWFF